MSNPPNYEVPAEMRDFAEKSVEQARKAFDSFIGAARRTADTVQGSAELARSNALDASSRGFEYAEQNVNAAFDLAQKLVRSRDMQEAMQHQAEFVRSQFAAIQAQAKEFSGLAQSADAAGRGTRQVGDAAGRRRGPQGHGAGPGRRQADGSRTPRTPPSAPRTEADIDETSRGPLPSQGGGPSRFRRYCRREPPGGRVGSAPTEGFRDAPHCFRPIRPAWTSPPGGRRPGARRRRSERRGLGPVLRRSGLRRRIPPGPRRAQRAPVGYNCRRGPAGDHGPEAVLLPAAGAASPRRALLLRPADRLVQPAADGRRSRRSLIAHGLDGDGPRPFRMTRPVRRRRTWARVFPRRVLSSGRRPWRRPSRGRTGR